MTHAAERHQSVPRPEALQNRRNNYRDRSTGAQALRAVDLRRPGTRTDGENLTSLTNQMAEGARKAAVGHLRRVRDVYKREKGVDLPMNADTVRLAFISQQARLNDEKITDDMTQSQLTNELMALAIFFAPQASDALKTHRHRQSKAILSQYNDIVGRIARSLPRHLVPGQKTAVIDALRHESLALNQQIGHSSEISGKDPESRLGVINTIMTGVSGEIAPENALQDDPDLTVIIPQDTESDLRGIDMMVRRKSDGKTINIDTKSHGKYLSTVAEHEGVDWVDERSIGPYYFVKMHENGNPHYLLNASAFGEIPAEGLDYTPTGQKEVREAVHQMLNG